MRPPSSPDSPRFAARSAFLFDLDGTLVDSSASHAEAFRLALGELSPEIARDFDYDVVRGTTTLEALERIGVPGEDQRARVATRKRAIYRERIAHGALHLFPMAREVLSLLRAKGRRLVVVTSASRNSASSVLASTGIAPMFEGLVTGDDVERGKPDPQSFLLAISLFRLAPEASLTVEDAPVGVEASLAAGIDAIIVHASPAPVAVPGFADFRQLYEVLDKELA